MAKLLYTGTTYNSQGLISGYYRRYFSEFYDARGVLSDEILDNKNSGSTGFNFAKSLPQPFDLGRDGVTISWDGQADHLHESIVPLSLTMDFLLAGTRHKVFPTSWRKPRDRFWSPSSSSTRTRTRLHTPGSVSSPPVRDTGRRGDRIRRRREQRVLTTHRPRWPGRTERHPLPEGERRRLRRRPSDYAPEEVLRSYRRRPSGLTSPEPTTRLPPRSPITRPTGRS